ncbi:MAG: pro-sigmaK processing inhibitor BofA family protein [Clostridia bacterium]|nr:pro-sigmaK processing inhibitor BofA family protein [Clostridia bacterium]
MPLDAGSILLYTAGLFLLYLCCWIFIKPIKWLLRLGGSCLLGGVTILLWNLVGSGWGMPITPNPLTAMFAGVLGVPGMILTGILERIL